LTCNAATYRFRDIRFSEGQNFGFWGTLDWGSAPKMGDCARTDMYHYAKFHADRWCHRRRDICNLTHITADLIQIFYFTIQYSRHQISDKTRTGVAFVDKKHCDKRGSQTTTEFMPVQ